MYGYEIPLIKWVPIDLLNIPIDVHPAGPTNVLIMSRPLNQAMADGSVRIMSSQVPIKMNFLGGMNETTPIQILYPQIESNMERNKKF